MPMKYMDFDIWDVLPRYAPFTDNSSIELSPDLSIDDL